MSITCTKCGSTVKEGAPYCKRCGWRVPAQLRLSAPKAERKRKGGTQTGRTAAIAAAVRTTEELPAEFKIRKIGMGAGKRQYELPGILRAMLIEELP